MPFQPGISALRRCHRASPSSTSSSITSSSSSSSIVRYGSIVGCVVHAAHRLVTILLPNCCCPAQAELPLRNLSATNEFFDENEIRNGNRFVKMDGSERYDCQVRQRPNDHQIKFMCTRNIQSIQRVWVSYFGREYIRNFYFQFFFSFCGHYENEIAQPKRRRKYLHKFVVIENVYQHENTHIPHPQSEHMHMCARKKFVRSTCRSLTTFM